MNIIRWVLWKNGVFVAEMDTCVLKLWYMPIINAGYCRTCTTVGGSL